MSSRNITSSPGIRYGIARALGHTIGRAARWYTGLGMNWKLSLGFMAILPPSWMYKERLKAQAKTVYYNRAVKDCVFMDFAVGSRYIGRVLIGLYSDQVPLTCENFIQLAEGFKVGNKVIGYRNTDIHQVHPQLGMIGGDVVTGKGTHQLSIYGPKFADENFDMDFIQDGDVCMYSNATDSNGSQFMITFRPHRNLYGHAVVFGTVIKGMRVIRMIEDLGTQFGMPMERVRIVNCGLYRGYQDGPPFFSITEALERYDKGPISEDAFVSLPAEAQEKIVSSHKVNTAVGLSETSGASYFKTPMPVKLETGSEEIYRKVFNIVDKQKIANSAAADDSASTTISINRSNTNKD